MGSSFYVKDNVISAYCTKLLLIYSLALAHSGKYISALPLPLDFLYCSIFLRAILVFRPCEICTRLQNASRLQQYYHYKQVTISRCNSTVINLHGYFNKIKCLFVPVFSGRQSETFELVGAT